LAIMTCGHSKEVVRVQSTPKRCCVARSHLVWVWGWGWSSS